MSHGYPHAFSSIIIIEKFQHSMFTLVFFHSEFNKSLLDIKITILFFQDRNCIFIVVRSLYSHRSSEFKCSIFSYRKVKHPWLWIENNKVNWTGLHLHFYHLHSAFSSMRRQCIIKIRRNIDEYLLFSACERTWTFKKFKANYF